MSCNSAQVSGVLEVKVKMRRFREKEMMGRRVVGKVEPFYEPISFSAKAASIYHFMTPNLLFHGRLLHFCLPVFELTEYFIAFCVV